MTVNPANGAGSEVEGFLFPLGVFPTGKLLGQAYRMSHKFEGLRKNASLERSVRGCRNQSSEPVVVFLEKEKKHLVNYMMQ